LSSAGFLKSGPDDNDFYLWTTEASTGLLDLGFIFIIIIIMPPADSLVQMPPLFHLNGKSCKYS
jgi:hypothetical protein